MKAWVIGSLDVALVAREEADLKVYEASRYRATKDIAKFWLNHISKLSKKDGESLKHELTASTLLGEFVGASPFHSKVLTYPSP